MLFCLFSLNYQIDTMKTLDERLQLIQDQFNNNHFMVGLALGAIITLITIIISNHYYGKRKSHNDDERGFGV